jgi:hypothetical protein
MNDKTKSGEHPAVRELHRTLQVVQVETEQRCAASERRMDAILRSFLGDEDEATRDTLPSLPGPEAA